MMQDLVTSPQVEARYAEIGAWDGSTLEGRVATIASTNPSSIAVVDELGGRRTTYRQLWDDACSVADHLRSRGLIAGDVVSIQLPNVYESVVAALATRIVGGVINPILPNYRQNELAGIFATADPKAIFTPEIHRGTDYVDLVDDACQRAGRTIHQLTLGPGRPGATVGLDGLLGDALGATPVSPPDTHDAAAPSEVIFTSGTEAKPKAILHTEHTANFSVRAAVRHLAMSEADVVWMPSPVGHSTGFNYGTRLALYHGLTLVLQDRWDAADALALVASEGCTYTLAAATFLKDLTDVASREGARLDSLRRFACGGAPVPSELVAAAGERGINVLRLYGSTEALVVSCHFPDAPLDERAVSDGTVLEGIEVEIRDDAGQPAAVGDRGELYIRGPNTCVGFFRDAERTAATFGADGWVRSGDVLTLDGDRHLSVVGRSKEIIIRGGMNIAPREIEDLLLRIDVIEEAAVVGVPDERLGETACACVVLAAGAHLLHEQMVEELEGFGLATYKLPERLHVLESLPRTPSGKVQKHVILDALLDAEAVQ